jgi:dienelactone hydrolase
VRKLALTTLIVAGCSDLSLDPAQKIVHARFDPDARSIPMPTDILRDATAGHLKLDDARSPSDSPAATEFYDYLETLDGWSTLMSATVEFTGPIDPRSIGDSTIEVWHWGATPERVADVRFELTPDGKKLQIDPPPSGWLRGEKYVAVLRGRDNGVHGAEGEEVECDAAFYFLRQTQRLDTPDHNHAFPGETYDERAANAAKLESIREDLSPAFDFMETLSWPRTDVAALWQWTVTTHTEMAMDQPSQRIPLPIDLMIDPATGHVDAPAAPWDSPTEAEAKGRLSEFDGMSLSGDQLFEFTAAMDPKSLTSDSVQLWQLGGGQPLQIPATVTLLQDGQHIEVAPKLGRLDEKTTYVIRVTDDVRDATGAVPALMPIGHFLKSHAPISVDGSSQISAIADADALKLENSRSEQAAALDTLGREHTLAIWPLTTMTVSAPLVALRQAPATVGVSPDPANIVHMTPTQALADFPFGLGSIVNVGDVYYGTIQTPIYLDPQSRQWRADGKFDIEDIKFTMTVPKNVTGPVPVVIFGHGLITERRFVLALGDALAAMGFAAISIDFPYHGDRTYCATGGPISLVNPLDGSLTSLDPCQSGSTCNDYGKCVDAQGNGNHLATFGVISTPIASGARFLEIDHIANSKDHFQQALVDLGSLDRSLRTGAWQAVIGQPIDTSRIYYSGQSLGGIMGGVFLGSNPDIARAVLNVPGAGLVPMFDNSPFFSSQMNAFFTRQHVDRNSYQGHRFMAVAHWFMDAVDPQHLGNAMMAKDRAVMLQMATLDEIIPNANTELLQSVTHAPRRDYVAEHGFLVIPVEPEYWRGTSELAGFLSGDFQP